MTIYKDGTTLFVKPEVVGTKLQRKLPKMSVTQRALLGHELRKGTAPVSQFSPRQTAKIVEVPNKLIRAVAAATPFELWRMQHGWVTIEEVHARQVAAKRSADAAVDKAVTKIGKDLVLAALDRLTAPATNGSATPTSNGHVAPSPDAIIEPTTNSTNHGRQR